MKKPNGRGSWMVHEACDREYAQQVTAEHKVNIRKGGVTKQVWQPKYQHADNHYLDCEVGAMCAADILGVRTLHLQNEEQEAQKTTPPELSEKQTAEEQWIQTNENWL